MGEKGPQIGLGCDIYISNDCNVDGKSGSNLGGSFEVPSNMFYGSREAKQYLCGEENFYIEDYEVF